MNELPGITREDEEERLAYVVDIAQTNLERTQNAVKSLNDDLHEMLETYGAKDVEALALWNNTVVQLEETKTDLIRSEKARKKPYFGRIDFTDDKLKKQEAYYIGRVGIAKDITHLEVIDWRAPIATVYYENSLGTCKYSVKNEGTYSIDLTRKRTYEIEKDTLKDFYDSDVVANDELLTKYLAKNKKAVLGEIIATIQQEQNSIIRKSPKQNIIVQGVAGSGKTTVAMHRISYILYNYEEDYRPEDFYIVGSNRILLNYITSVLPDLDVYGIKQMTMEQLFTRLLYEDWDERTMKIKTMEKGDMTAVEKGSFDWFHDLEQFCADLEWETIPRDTIKLNRAAYGLNAAKNKELGKVRNQLLLSREAIETYIKENPHISMQNKILMLNERIMAKVQNEIMGKEIGYTPEDKKEIQKTYRFYFGPKLWKGSIFEIYEDFLNLQDVKGKTVPYEAGNYDVYDLAALAYLYKRIKETEEVREASHVVIDEAQDFGMMSYAVLKYCMRIGCTFTIMGDVSQNISFGYGLNDWEELKEHFLTGTYDSFNLLKKSYRNTVEISNFATDILKHGTFPIYPVEPILRHGNSVRVEKCEDDTELIKEAASTIKKWQKKDLETIAVVCRDEEEAKAVTKKLGKKVKLSNSNLDTAEFGNGVMVLPVKYTKGLEFDAVIILDPSREAYPSDNGHVKLLYVAATRALHELVVLHKGDLTGIIEDPIPEGKQFEALVEKEAPKKLARKVGTHSVKDSVVAELKNFPELSKVEAKISTEKSRTTKPRTAVGPKKIEVSDSQKIKEEKVPMVAPGGAKTSQAHQELINKRMRVQTEREIQSDARRKLLEKPMALNIAPAGTVRHEGQEATKAARAALKAKNAASIQGKQSTTTNSITNTTTDDVVKVTENSIYEVQRTSSSVVTHKNVTTSEKKNTSLYKFGDIPEQSKIRPLGHSRVDCAVRWNKKTPDYVDIASSYGTLRITPVTAEIVRVSFMKGQIGEFFDCDSIAMTPEKVKWNCRETRDAIEITTEKLLVKVEKKIGAVNFYTKDGKQLLSENAKEPRLLDQGMGSQNYMFFDWEKNEKIWAKGILEDDLLKMNLSAKYISYGNRALRLPCILSDKGYGIAFAAEDVVMCCNISVYGTYIMTEHMPQIDYYFMYGGSAGASGVLYKMLTGKM